MHPNAELSASRRVQNNQKNKNLHESHTCSRLIQIVPTPLLDHKSYLEYFYLVDNYFQGGNTGFGIFLDLKIFLDFPDFSGFEIQNFFLTFEFFFIPKYASVHRDHGNPYQSLRIASAECKVCFFAAKTISHFNINFFSLCLSCFCFAKVLVSVENIPY